MTEAALMAHQGFAEKAATDCSYSALDSRSLSQCFAFTHGLARAIPSASVEIMGAIMTKPTHARFELHAIDERVKLVLLVSFGAALVTGFGFSLLAVWAG